MPTRRPSRAWLAAGIAGLVSCRTPEPPEAPPSPAVSLAEAIPGPLLLEANQGRKVLRADGFFAIPSGVTRVFVDVGAHDLETTGEALKANPDVALVAIEPLRESWSTWPRDSRLIGLPVAISTKRGWMDFHVNASDVTSSLAETLPSHASDDVTHTVEVRSVPVLRLEDVLAHVPPELDLEYLKTDVQGHDLQVLKSAAGFLRRFETVRCEVINEPIYGSAGGERPGTEEEFVRYMDQMGFSPIRDIDVQPGRRWLDKVFANRARTGWFWRTWQRVRHAPFFDTTPPEPTLPPEPGPSPRPGD